MWKKLNISNLMMYGRVNLMNGNTFTSPLFARLYILFYELPIITFSKQFNRITFIISMKNFKQIEEGVFEIMDNSLRLKHPNFIFIITLLVIENLELMLLSIQD